MRYKNNGKKFLPADLSPRKIVPYKRRIGLGDLVRDTGFEHSGLAYPVDENLPIDLQPRSITVPTGRYGAAGAGGFGYPNNLNDQLLSQIADDAHILAATNVLDKGLLATVVTVTTEPTLLIRSQYLRGYIILNPATIVGTTSTGTVLASASRSSTGNTQADVLSVANYRDLHLFLDVTAVPGAGATLDIFSQALDPLSAKWADIQNIFPAITATGTYYANVGSLGLTTDFAIRWSISSGNFTFSIGFVLKEGLPGTSNGLSNTVYLGNSGVTTTAGFPLLEGQSRGWYLRENTELWAIAGSTLELRVFAL